MKIMAIFDTPGMTATQYEQVDQALTALGQQQPQGRLHHVAAPNENGWLVIDVWESQAALDHFAQTLMPIFAEHDIPTTVPQILPVHNIIQP